MAHKIIEKTVWEYGARHFSTKKEAEDAMVFDKICNMLTDRDNGLPAHPSEKVIAAWIIKNAKEIALTVGVI